MRRLRPQNTMRRALAALAAVAAVAAVAAGPPEADSGTARIQAVAETRPTAGPPYVFTTALMDGRQVGHPLTNVAQITRSVHGYVYHAGSQDNHLVLRLVKGGLRFADRATPRFTSLPAGCRKARARRGVAAVCRVPAGISRRKPLLVEVWPRIGNDFLDSTRLPARFSVTMLGDLGNDVAHFGPGADFFNGHTGRDRVWGGGGDDWIRTGGGDDFLSGGPGNDWLVGMEDNDVIRGGSGDDRLAGMDGNDKLYPGDGSDFVLCGTGIDTAALEADDTSRDCEIR